MRRKSSKAPQDVGPMSTSANRIEAVRVNQSEGEFRAFLEFVHKVVPEVENRLPSVFILYCKIFLRFFTGFAFFAMILFLSFLQMTSFSILAIQE